MRLKGLVALCLAATALFVAACSSSDVSESDLDKANARIDQLQAQATKGQLLAVTNAIRAENLHGLDEAINAADTIDTTWLGSAMRSRRAVASVEWPADMKDAADTLKASLTDLENALTEGNLSDAKPAASASHENYHELDHMVSPFLANETPAPEATEAASGSPSAAATASH
jgi:hypothetical protein